MQGDAGRAADQEDAVELARMYAGVVEGGGHRAHGATEQLVDVPLEVRAAQLAGEMLRLTVHRGDVILLDADPGPGRERDLGFLGRPPEPRLQERVLAGVLDAELGLDVGVQALGDHRVEVVAAETVVPGGRQHLHHAVLDRHHRDVEGAAAEVVDEDPAASLAAALVAQRRRGRLVDDPHDLQARDLPRLPGGLALGVGGSRRGR